MDTCKCKYCDKEIKLSEKELHENYCLYTNQEDEYQDLIPCEFCDEFISFKDYEEHTKTCNNYSIIPLFDSLLNTINNQRTTLTNQNNNLNNLFTTFTESINNYSSQQNNISSINMSNLNLISNNNINHSLNLFNNFNITNSINTISNTEEPQFDGIFTFYNPSFMSSHNSAFNLSLFGENTYSDLINLSEEIGDVEIGIDDINKVSKIIKKIDMCPICRNDKEDLRILKCDHIFCDECIKKWLSKNKTCPICLKDLTD
tara:strand:- start:424 stop:1200 length:777 start_codon:yes stop_codon:yes gene_type:complete